MGSRVSARGLAWDLVEVAQLGRKRASAALRGGRSGWPGMGYPVSRRTGRNSTLGAAAGSAGPLASWRLHHIACLLEQVPGPDDMLAAEPGRVTIEPYQLVPLMRALEMPRPRLLLADGVGLGKTIQAGLIATELIARRRAHRILVVSPAGPLLMQWEHELRQRFGLRFTADHRCRDVATGTPQDRTRRQSVRQHRAVPDLARFRQAGTRAGGAGTFVLGPGDHRRGASLHRRRPAPTATTPCAGGWPKSSRGAATDCCC